MILRLHCIAVKISEKATITISSILLEIMSKCKTMFYDMVHILRQTITLGYLRTSSEKCMQVVINYILMVLSYSPPSFSFHSLKVNMFVRVRTGAILSSLCLHSHPVCVCWSIVERTQDKQSMDWDWGGRGLRRSLDDRSWDNMIRDNCGRQKGPARFTPSSLGF